jgi:hypothetical protein
MNELILYCLVKLKECFLVVKSEHRIRQLDKRMGGKSKTMKHYSQLRLKMLLSEKPMILMLLY